MDAYKLVSMLAEVHGHLNNSLLPFWKTHGSDKEYGGFLTYLDINDDWSKIENTIISSFSWEKMKNKETDSTNQEDLGEVSEEVVE